MAYKINRTIFYFILSYSLLLNLAITGIVTNHGSKAELPTKENFHQPQDTYPNIIEELNNAPAITVLPADKLNIEELESIVTKEVEAQAKHFASK